MYDDDNSTSNAFGEKPLLVDYSNSPDNADRSRPTSITVICWLSIISLVINSIQILGLLKDASLFPAWLWLYLLVSYGLTVTSIVGLWSMKKYGVWTFTIQAIMGTLFSFIAGGAGTALLGIVLSLIFLYFIFKKYDLME